jgi:hypothetical protein
MQETSIGLQAAQVARHAEKGFYAAHPLPSNAWVQKSGPSV